MLIKQLRLKNIKSFGSGPGGDGILIKFDQGLNRIGGKNGSGKSSIIEALGYALFDAEPVRGDNRVRVNTYLVRDGSKTGEIDVWLETDDCIYRVERDVGQTIRRWKVVKDDDGYSEAEGEEEVKRFLACLWGMSGPERLAELFHGLIGVKQGHFTFYFDCAPTMAKSHFDPILDVDIFRACFEYLRDPLRSLAEQQSQIENSISSLTGEIAQLKDAPEQVAKSQSALKDTELIWHHVAEQVAQIAARVKNHETALQQKHEAEKKYTEAQAALQQAETEETNAQKETAESETALAVMNTMSPGYQAYKAAEESAKKAEIQRTVRDQLNKQENALKTQMERLNEEKKQRATNLTNIRQDIATKQKEARERETELTARTQAYQQLEAEVTQVEVQHQAAASLLDIVKGWAVSLGDILQQYGQEFSKLQQLALEVSQFNPLEAAEATKALESASQVETEIKIALGKMEQAQEQLAKQMASIKGGICPFLGEKCQQFSPDQVQTQIDSSNSKLNELRATLKKASNKVQEAKLQVSIAQNHQQEYQGKIAAIKKGYETLELLWRHSQNQKALVAATSLTENWPAPALPELTPPANDRIADLSLGGTIRLTIHHIYETLGQNLNRWKEQFQQLSQTYQQGNALKAKEKGWLEQAATDLNRLFTEIKQLQERENKENQRMAAIEPELSNNAQTLQKIDAALEAYANLEQTMADLRRELAELNPQYTKYLQNEPIAQKLAARQERQNLAHTHTLTFQTQLNAAREMWQVAAVAFNSESFEKDKQEQRQLLEKQGQVRNQLGKAQEELERQKNRQTELTALLNRRQNDYRTLDRILAQNALLEKARNTLKNSQTLVAEGLTRQIQKRAQGIFNTLNKEPAQFEWDSTDYKLTIHTISGPRRFTQLSGGQQMKVAIAMQLALVREFSKAGICAFDEPTYGLDNESRQLLANAIALIQQECNFKQLLVVSHDEAFDDKVEHLINLGYSPTKGTEVISFD